MSVFSSVWMLSPIKCQAGAGNPGASVMGDLFDSVADGTRGVYQKHLAYFGRWCQGRGIRQSLVETDHIKVYVMEMREGRGLSVSWLGCAVAAVKKALEWERPLSGRAGLTG